MQTEPVGRLRGPSIVDAVVRNREEGWTRCLRLNSPGLFPRLQRTVPLNERQILSLKREQNADLLSNGESGLGTVPPLFALDDL